MTQIIVLAAALALAAGVSAQTPPPPVTDDDVNRVAHELYCPVCENTPLDVCPTQACAQWRDLIREKLALGWTDQQVRDYFVMQYGDRVLAAPPAQGFNWVFYVIIPVALLGAVGVLVSVLRRMVKHPAQTASAPQSAKPAADPDYLKRIEEELKKRG
ncbi:MAG TPA: cytochrome c-type biogenesis protein CcmH [Anaerolineaceae bacterium]